MLNFFRKLNSYLKGGRKYVLFFLSAISAIVTGVICAIWILAYGLAWLGKTNDDYVAHVKSEWKNICFPLYNYFKGKGLI